MSTELNLGDVPDFSAISDANSFGGGSTSEPLTDGWYQGTILAKREFTDNNGNDRVFESSDTPANANGRNIRLQVELKRRSDGKTFNLSALINYREEDLTLQTVQAIAQRQTENKTEGTQWGDLFRPFMVIQRLGKLQKIAGVRQFQRVPEGGLDLTPLYSKNAFFKLRPDRQKPQYKEIYDFQLTEPTRGVKVL